MSPPTCPTTNALIEDQSNFWTEGTFNWDAHRIGWTIAGGCAVATLIISGTNIFLHCRNYRKPLEQRQIVRILLMPVVFAVISFLGYRYFQDITYFELVRNTYEAFTIAAFLILMLFFLSDSPVEQREVLSKKEKRKMVFPLCCFRYRPSKPYFIWAVKWSVLQFVIIKPLLSIASIITEALGLYCAASQSPHFAHVYLEAVDFVSVSIALYGLITLYSLTREELAGHRPLAKFMTIKIIVALVFYQGFVFTILQHYNVIKATAYWTQTNISEGLNALVTTIEMVLIALFQLYAFPHTEYKLEMMDDRQDKSTSFWRSFIHSQNYSDFAIDIYHSLKFFVDRLRGKSYTKSSPQTTYTEDKNPAVGNRFDFHQAFIYDDGYASDARSYVHQPVDAWDKEANVPMAQSAPYGPPGQNYPENKSHAYPPYSDPYVANDEPRRERERSDSQGRIHRVGNQVYKPLGGDEGDLGDATGSAR